MTLLLLLAMAAFMVWANLHELERLEYWNDEREAEDLAAWMREVEP